MTFLLRPPGTDAGRSGLLVFETGLAHYVHDLALTSAPENIRMNAIHPTNCNTDMLHSPPIYQAPTGSGKPHP